MAKIPEEVLFDSRLIERHIRKGLITRKQVEDNLTKTRDVSDNADVLNLDELVAPRAAPAMNEDAVTRGQSWGPRGDTGI
jgi:hypothetical protein